MRLNLDMQILELSVRTELLNAIFELSPDGFISFDESLRLSYASPAFNAMTGMHFDQLRGMTEAEFSEQLNQLCTTNGKFRGFEALRQSAAQQRSGEREFIELTLVGQRTLEVGLRASSTSAVSQILYFRDVTHETEVDQMKSEFLSTAAHELRTPMASIYGFTEVLLTHELDEASRKELLAIIFRQAELMASILNELLDLARIEARRGKDFEIVSTVAQELVQEIVAGFKPPPGRDAPTLSMPNAPLSIMVDRKKAAQAIVNVLSNAYKYSVPGTGVSIVQEIVELHHGRLQIESQAGQGTTVTMLFPSGDPSPDLQCAPRSAPKALGVGPDGGKNEPAGTDRGGVPGRDLGGRSQ
jgi:PAS domain S-box-containing protein